MIAELIFEEPKRGSDGRHLRRVTFDRAMTISLAAACAVARAAIERMGQLLGCELEAELVEPIAVDSQSAATILAEARGVRVCAQDADAFVMIRPPDARALVAMAFGTARPANEMLSALEWRVVERLLGAVASTFGPLCGAQQRVVSELAAHAQTEARAYFEIRIIKPCRAAIGVGLTRVPPPRIHTSLPPAALNEVPMELLVTAGRANLSVADIAGFELGSLVPLNERLEALSAMSTADGVVVAHGVAGIEAGRYALRVAEPANA